MALADEAPVEPDVTTVEEAPVVEETVPEVAPVEEVAVEAPAPAPEQVAPIEAQKTPPKGHEPITFCHKPGTPAQQELTTDNQGFLNGHLNHGDSLGACPPVFETYEVCATWTVDPGNDLWPQTLVSRDCGYVPAAQCEPYKVQFDKYWIKDAEDKAYWESLTRLNSAADDQSLDPHGYYVKTIEAKDCAPKPINPIANGSVICGSATFNLYNPARYEGDVNLTASLVFWIDGKVAPEHIYAVASNETKTVTVTFPEDSGNHSVFVRTGFAQGDVYVWDQVVTTDCIPPKPDNKVTETQWQTGEYVCGDTTVQITREITTTEYTLVEGQWVEGESVTVPQTETRDLTKNEIDALNCEVVIPPTEEPKTPVAEEPKNTPPTEVAEGEAFLATTGGDMNPILPLTGLGILLAGAMLLVARKTVAKK